MKINVQIKHNILMPYETKDIDIVDGLKQDAVYSCEINNMDMRSLKQNSALHRYFALVSKELNNNHFTINNDLNLNLAWTPIRVKELIWKEFQKVVLGKESTKLLTKEELTKVYDYVNMYLGERFGFNIEFPNKQELI